MTKKILYLVIWPNGHEEKYYVESWKDLVYRIEEHSIHFGALPDLIYRKE